ncbi:MAG: PH domain-containing protein [Phycisphaerales bacterium]|nr:PH domain-containing protein [Planctomycetota bacterium]MCH8507316.1 PH domain-containing protein [Phycisphaerales bacterium]
MPDHRVLREAAFDPAVKKYFIIGSLLICVVTLIGIVLIPVVLIVGFKIIQVYLDRLSCVLTEHTLELKKGIVNRVESTVPLGKITDLHMYQGPLMRKFGLWGLRIETAGQTVGAGGLLRVVGIVDTPGFRKAVLDQRDRLENRSSGRRSSASTGPDGAETEIDEAAVLVEIRDAILRIERRLGEDRA